MGGGDGGASGKLKKAVKKILATSFCHKQQNCVSPVNIRLSHTNADPFYYSSSMEPESSPSSNKNLCTICLDPLDYISGSKAIFTAQCSHSFHFACITSNVTHGSLTCPVCRAHWTQLPRCPHHRPPPTTVAASRRSFYHYNNPINSNHISTTQTRLSFSLFSHPQVNETYLRVKLENQPPTDLILVANLKKTESETLAKQAMVMVVSSLRPIDRLAIVTCPSSLSSSLRRMTPCGKRTALRAIDQMSYNSQTDSIRVLEKGIEILENRVRENPRSCILHLTDGPSKPRRVFPIAVHQFGFDDCNGLITREFEEFLARTVGGGVEDVEVRVGERKNMVVRIGELRGGEERNIPLCVGESGHVWLRYSYRDGGCVRSGEVAVGVGADEGGGGSDCEDGFAGGNWGAHLHGYGI